MPSAPGERPQARWRCYSTMQTAVMAAADDADVLDLSDSSAVAQHSWSDGWSEAR